MKFIQQTAAILILILALGSGRLMADEPPQAPAVEAANRFAFDLLGQLPHDGNLFFSPYSIHTALAMTAAGAGGRTLEQMTKALELSDLPADKVHSLLGGLSQQLGANPQDNAYELRVANSLWGQKSFAFVPAFLDELKANYGATLTPVDFADSEAARTQINDWVAKQTNDKIKDLIGQGVLNGGTRLVLTNAIYFKGDWESPFKAEATASAPFHTSIDPNQAPIDVAMMNQTGSFAYAEDKTWQAMEMPYRGGLAMLILLPRGIESMADLVKPLDEKSLGEIISGFQSQRMEVSFPKFKLELTTPVMDALGKLGITDAFDSNLADFSGMDGKRDLFISAVIHKAFVNVDEKGSEAAAATAVTVTMTAVMEPQPTIRFNVDHPFLFLIRDTKTGAILFVGEVHQPDKFAAARN